MTQDIHIPPDAVEAAVAAANADDPYYVSRSQITAAIRAALAAWPGAEEHNFDGWTHAVGFVLPLTEPRDE